MGSESCSLSALPWARGKALVVQGFSAGSRRTTIRDDASVGCLQGQDWRPQIHMTDWARRSRPPVPPPFLCLAMDAICYGKGVWADARRVVGWGRGGGAHDAAEGPARTTRLLVPFRPNRFCLAPAAGQLNCNCRHLPTQPLLSGPGGRPTEL